MRSLILSLMLLSMIICPLPAAAETPAQGTTHQRRLEVPGGLPRDYLVRVPPGPARPRPLVIAMHGGGSDMHAMRELTGLDELADRDDTLVVYPNGVLTTWNAGSCCVFARMLGIDDVAFLDELI